MMDRDLEKAIDEVGRSRVFTLAENYGWPRGSTPPLHVWWGIVYELRQTDALAKSPRP